MSLNFVRERIPGKSSQYVTVNFVHSRLVWLIINGNKVVIPKTTDILAHLSQMLKWAIFKAHRPSSVFKLSHFQLLLQNHLMDFD